jgi:hypothetical protein
MKSTEIVDRSVLNERRLTELADQVDPAIGDAASVLGAMTTEIVRRSLRGGVMEIGRELSVFVGQEVELQLAEQRPLIEKTAAMTATEVARGEVDAVRQAASEQAQRLAARIDEATQLAQQEAKLVARDLAGRLEEKSRLAHEQTQSVARDLTGRLEETSRLAHEQAQSVARELADRLEENSRLAHEQTQSVARELAGRLEETSRLAQDQAQSVARDLNGRLEETSKKTHERIEVVAKVADDTARQSNEATASLSHALQTEVAAVETRTLTTTRKEFTEQIEQVRERSRLATLKIVERLNKQDSTTTHLGNELGDLKQELLSTCQINQKVLLEHIDNLRRANESMAKRLEVLERPRGLRAFFARLFGKKKKQPSKSVVTELDKDSE